MRPIERVVAPVRGQVQDALRSAIERGDLRPGDRLIERELCELMGVSRPLVREALRGLESEGLARPLPRGGMAVTTLSREEALQIYTVRREMEGLAAELFAENAGDHERQELKDAIATLRASLSNEDAESTLQSKNRFYALLCTGSGNVVLSDLLRNIHGRIKLLRGTSLSKPGRSEQMVEELAAIAEALLTGNAKAARRLTEVHIANAMAATDEALDSKKPSSRLAG